MNRIGNSAEGIIAYHGTDKTGFAANLRAIEQRVAANLAEVLG